MEGSHGGVTWRGHMEGSHGEDLQLRHDVVDGQELLLALGDLVFVACEGLSHVKA